MSRIVLAAAAVALLAAPALANPGKPIETGAQLQAACQALASAEDGAPENALSRPDACKAYLGNFVRVFEAQSQAALDASLQGGGPGAGEEMRCIAFPEFLSFKEFAQIVTAYVAADAARGGEPAFEVTSAALAEKFPCAE
ncbi:MAG TPA: hypothetical protein PL096_09715 [Micropepsaceae bacterium]|nr:hypothetical protein [Micropepsaceae bacterium]